MASLAELGQLSAACRTIADLIEEVGSGTTPIQRLCVAQAYMLQAKHAEARGQFDEAVKALDAAIAHCSRDDEPDLRKSLHEAEQMKQSLQARVRPAR
jgi:hypothetical protein